VDSGFQAMYLQTTVCKSVKKNLSNLFPGGFSHTVPLCVRCKDLKTDEECRFKRKYNLVMMEKLDVWE
jgi:hypothetical protein